MPIRRNDSDSFPGAQSMFALPVVKSECCLFQDVQTMMEQASAEGWPATVKGGVAYINASLAQIQGVCLIGLPTVGSVFPDPLEELSGWNVLGANFGLVEGQVWLGSANTWAGSGTRVQQVVVGWSVGTIAVDPPVLDGLPWEPAHVYVYVINDCGQRNAVGFETEVAEEPP